MIDQAHRLRELVKRSKSDKTQDLSGANSKARIITFVSGKGGVGKSVILANLALALKKLNKRVLLIDTESGFTNIEFILNVAAKTKLLDIIEDRVDINKEFGDIASVNLVDYGSGLSHNPLLDDEQVELLIAKIRSLENMDFVLIDTVSGLNNNVMDLVLASGQIFVVTTADPASLTESYAAIKAMALRDKNLKFNLLVNMVKTKEEAMRIFERINSVAERFLQISLEYSGFVLYSNVVSQSVKQRQPFVANSANCQPAILLNRLANLLVIPEKNDLEGKESLINLEKVLT